jgi:hypothetical protein
VTNEKALLDSGATENFLDEQVWKTLNIRCFKLKRPLTVHNMDGTENCQGKITHCCWLKIHYQNQTLRMHFFLTDLGKDCFILGYPFLFAFNPEVDWRAAMLPPRQAAKLSRCGCDPSWFCSPHDACFIHKSCLCEGSSRWPPVKLVHSSWVSLSREWLADLLSHRSSSLPSS